MTFRAPFQLLVDFLSQNNNATKVQVDLTTITLDKGWCGYYLVRISSAHLIVAAKKLINWHFDFPIWINVTYRFLQRFELKSRIARKSNDISRNHTIFRRNLCFSLSFAWEYRMATWSNNCVKGYSYVIWRPLKVLKGFSADLRSDRDLKYEYYMIKGQNQEIVAKWICFICCATMG